MKKNKIRNIDLFLIISFAGTILFLLLLIGGKGLGAEWLVMENNFDYSFTDHFRHIVFASDMKNFYFNTYDATFPAFAYLLYYLLYRINPGKWDIADWKGARDYNYNMLVFLMLTIVLVLAFKEVVDKILIEYSNGRKFLFVFSLILSAPLMAGAIERGNISFLTAVLVLSALYLKDSDKAWKRELALILIAFAAGLKIYPAIVGIVYVRDKRYKETMRLIIYGLIVFLVPFAFTGGIAGFIQYLKVLFFFEGQGYRSWTNIRNYLLSLSDLMGLYEKSGSFVWVFKVIENVFLALCVITVFRTKTEWKKALYPAFAMALYVPYSYRYTSVYMLIPLILFIKDCGNETDGIFNRVYTILFALIFTIPIWGIITEVDANFFIFTPIYIIFILSFIEDWFIKNTVPDNMQKS